MRLLRRLTCENVELRRLLASLRNSLEIERSMLLESMLIQEQKGGINTAAIPSNLSLFYQP